MDCGYSGLSVDCDYLTLLWWTVCGVDCGGLWLVTVYCVELSLLWTLLVVSYCGLYVDCSYCGLWLL